jgi:hypothetical protein
MKAIVDKRGRNEDAGAIQYWQSFGIASKGGLIEERDFALWNDWLAQRGEVKPGQVKVSDVYTNELNGLGG